MKHTDKGKVIGPSEETARHLTGKIRDNVRQFTSDPDILAAGPQLNP